MIEGNIVKDVHVGEALRAWCKRNNLTRQKLADKMELPKSNIDRMFAKPTIDTNRLLDISHALDHNFFAELWREEKGEYDIYEVSDTETLPSYIHIGNKIEMCLREKKISQNQLAAHLGVQHPVVSKLLRKKSIDSGRLVVISNFLKHDFFADFYIDVISNEVKEKRFLSEKVADLEKTIELLQEENSLLKQKIAKYEGQ